MKWLTYKHVVGIVTQIFNKKITLIQNLSDLLQYLSLKKVLPPIFHLIQKRFTYFIY